MKSLLNTIQQRRSISPSDYTGGMIDKAHIDQILESSRWAPNHKKTQPWRYKVVQDSGLKKLGTFMTEQFVKDSGKPESFKSRKLSEKIQKSSAVILIFMSRHPKEAIPEWEEIAAVSMSVQNMWLMAHDLGYGCYWSSPKSFANMEEFDSITVSEYDKFLGFLYLGTVASQNQELPERKSPDDYVEFVS